MNWLAVYPELVLLGMACVVALVDLWVTHPRRTPNYLLTQATLIRANPLSGELEPRLATEWIGSPDGLTWTFTLRNNLKFSAGVPFPAADVFFTFQALYDPRAASPLGNQIQVAGQPLQVRAIDDGHVEVKLPAPFGPGLAMLDSVPILPRHKLQVALDQGTFRAAWSPP